MKKLNLDSEWVTRIVAVLCALVFWLFVIASENPNVYASAEDVPVTFVGIQDLTRQNLVMTSGAQSFVDLRFNGKLDRMYRFNEKTVAVTVDLSSILAPGEYHLPYSVDTGASGVEATKQTEHITVTVERLVTRTFPVELKVTQQPEEGYVCTEMSLDRDAVVITGPESIATKVKGIQSRFSFSGIRSSGSKTLEYWMVDEAGNTFVSDDLSSDIGSLQLNYVIQQRKQVPLSVEVSATELIGTDRIKCKIEPAQLSVVGTPAYISGINEIKLGSINLLDQIRQGRVEGNQIELTLPVSLPNGVVWEDAPKEAKVTIELAGLAQQNVVVPAEYFVPVRNLRYVTDSLNVQLLGTLSELAATNPVTVLVTPLITAEEMEVGPHTIPVRVDCDRSVTVVGTYTVDVYVEEIVAG